MEFMKKYIHIAKCVKPKLTSEAAKIIADEYASLRSRNLEEDHMARTQPITARSLETMIRLATAHARARMSKDVTKEDALVAIELVQFAYFKRVLEKEKRKRKQRDEEDEEMDVEEESPADEGEERGENGDDSRRSKRSKKDASREDDPYDLPTEENETLAELKKKASGTSQSQDSMDVDAPEEGSISDERYVLVAYKQRYSLDEYYMQACIFQIWTV